MTRTIGLAQRLAAGVAVLALVGGCAIEPGPTQPAASAIPAPTLTSSLLPSAWPSIVPSPSPTATAAPLPTPAPPATPAPTPSVSPAPTVAPSATPAPIRAWTAVPDQAAVTKVQFLDVVWTGRRFVATGMAAGGAGVFLDSVDGLTWHRQKAFAAEAYPMRLAAGPSGVVAVGSLHDRRASWFSADGRSWTSSAAGAFPVSRLGADVASVTDAVATDDGWLAVGRIDPQCNVGCGSDPVRALAWTSRDGLAWTPVPRQAAFADGGMSAVTRSSAGFVAAGDAGGHAAIWTSPDGTRWTRVPDAAMFGPSSGTTGWMPVSAMGVAARDGAIVVVGMAMSDGGGVVRAWWSADGRTWAKATVRLALQGQVFDVTATSNGFLATGPSGRPSCRGGIWASANGRTWRCVASDRSIEGFGPYAAAASPTREIVVGLTDAGWDENSPDGLPGAVWWRPAP